jgi:hypothetical protein
MTTGALAALRLAATRLPAQFLILALLMGGMMAGLILVIDREARHREAVYAPLLSACLRVMESR